MIKEGYVWEGKDGGLFMERCPKCGKENWALAVASGQCAWCGYEAKEKDVDISDNGNR